MLRKKRTPITGRTRAELNKDKKRFNKKLTDIIDSAVDIETESYANGGVKIIVTQSDGQQIWIEASIKSKAVLI
ncbi:MAG: hypothetical protein OXG68_17950 [Chloroflexi bacterium]|nr:hypothetical protein [Chloroflexota bacterium]